MFGKEVVDPAVRDFIVREYRHGLVAQDCIGLHGTSLYSMKYVLANGVLPGETRDGWASENPGDVFYTPLERQGVITPNDMRDATFYANKNAARHFLKMDLGLSMASSHDDAMIDFLIGSGKNLKDDAYTKLFKNRGWTVGQIEKSIQEAKRQRGVIIGFSTEVLNRYSISTVGRISEVIDGPKIETSGAGLPFSMIHGIKALGSTEAAYFNRL